LIAQPDQKIIWVSSSVGDNLSPHRLKGEKMKNVVQLAGLVVIGLTTAQAASAERVNPHWAQFPSERQFVDYIGTDQEADIKGAADLLCTITRNDGHVRCNVSPESAVDSRYGEAAARVVTQYGLLDLKSMPNAGVGDYVVVRTTFNIR
jgi:hypothetical protein